MDEISKQPESPQVTQPESAEKNEQKESLSHRDSELKTKESLELVKGYLERNPSLDDPQMVHLFKSDQALEMLSGKNSKAQAVAYDRIKKAKEILTDMTRDKFGEMDLVAKFEDPNKRTFQSTLNKELIRRSKNQHADVDVFNEIMKGYNTFHQIKKVQEHYLTRKAERMDKTKPLRKTIDYQIWDNVKEIGSNIKKNWDSLDENQRIAAGAALVIGGVLFLTSQNDKVVRARETLMKGLTWLGVGVGVNLSTKLINKKTLIENIRDVAAGDTGKREYFERTFGVDSEKAEVMQKAQVFLFDKDFLELAKKYKEARAKGTEKIDLVTVKDKEMTPEEIYTAMDVVIEKYRSQKVGRTTESSLEEIEQRFKDESLEQRTYLAVTDTLMIESGDMKVEENVAYWSYNQAREGAIRGWNGFFATTEGMGIMKDMYYKTFKVEGSESEVKKWMKDRFKEDVMDEASLDQFVESTMTKQYADNFKKAMNVRLGEHDVERDVRFYKAKNDAMYAVASVPLDNMAADEELIGEAINTAEERLYDFLGEHFPADKENLQKYAHVVGGARVIKDRQFKMFIRMPLPGTPQYEQINAGQATTADFESRRGIEIFGEKNSIEYDALENADRAKLRLKFALDENQKAELDAICDWYTMKYRTKGKTIKHVYDRLLGTGKEYEEERKMALEQTDVKQGLAKNINLLKAFENLIINIEKGAAKDVKGMNRQYLQVVDELRAMQGYNVRLAILGDSKAKSDLGYTPGANGQDIEYLLENYRKYCDHYVEQRNLGLT